MIRYSISRVRLQLPHILRYKRRIIAFRGAQSAAACSRISEIVDIARITISFERPRTRPPVSTEAIGLESRISIYIQSCSESTMIVHLHELASGDRAASPFASSRERCSSSTQYQRLSTFEPWWCAHRFATFLVFEFIQGMDRCLFVQTERFSSLRASSASPPFTCVESRRL